MKEGCRAAFHYRRNRKPGLLPVCWSAPRFARGPCRRRQLVSAACAARTKGGGRHRQVNSARIGLMFMLLRKEKRSPLKTLSEDDL